MSCLLSLTILIPPNTYGHNLPQVYGAMYDLELYASTSALSSSSISKETVSVRYFAEYICGRCMKKQLAHTEVFLVVVDIVFEVQLSTLGLIL